MGGLKPPCHLAYGSLKPHLRAEVLNRRLLLQSKKVRAFSDLCHQKGVHVGSKGTSRWQAELCVERGVEVSCVGNWRELAGKGGRVVLFQ